MKTQDYQKLDIHLQQAILNTLNNLLTNIIMLRAQAQPSEQDKALLDYHAGLTHVMNKKVEDMIGPCVSQDEVQTHIVDAKNKNNKGDTNDTGPPTEH